MNSVGRMVDGLFRAGAIAAICALASGCASMIDGGTQMVSFRSEPSGADVFFMGQKVGMTPLSIQVKRIPNAEVRLHLEGYKDAQLTLKAVTNPKIWYNAVFCLTTYGVPSTLTDLSSGAFYQYMPDQYFATMDKAGSVFWEDDHRARTLRYALFNHDGLRSDISRGRGDYLDALYDLGGISEFGVREEKLRVLKTLAAANGDAVDFATAATRSICGEIAVPR